MKRLVALYRSPTYSPTVHRRNDTAILDDTVAALERRGWQVSRAGEGEVMTTTATEPERGAEELKTLPMLWRDFEVLEITLKTERRKKDHSAAGSSRLHGRKSAARCGA